MSNDEGAVLTLTREDLYELVWSKPMRELANDFGISDVALAKRCRGLGLPVPGRGYWARLDAGQSPHRPKLPVRQTEWGDHRALTVAPAQEAPATIRSPADSPEEAERIRRADAAWLDEHIAFESRPDSLVHVPDAPKSWSPGIRSIRDDLQKAATEMRASRKASDSYDKWPESRKRAESCKESWKWLWSKDKGQRIWESHKPIAFRVSLGTYDRALSIVNALALAAHTRGFSIRDDRDLGRVVFSGHEADIQMRITEQLERKHRPRVGYDGKTEQESYLVPTGRLRISLQTGYPEGPAFEDKGTKRLDSMLNPIFVAMYRLVVKRWVWERDRQEAQRRAEEAERQRALERKIQEEQARKAAAEQARRQQLSEEIKHWNMARRIREYVAHIHAGDPGHTRTDAWTQWALAVADDLDPTAMRTRKVSEE